MLAEFLFCGELLADSTNISLPDMLTKKLGGVYNILLSFRR